MPRIIPHCLLVLLLPLLLSTPATAGDIRYITDQLVVSLRDTMSEDAKIVDSLRTGTELEVLGEEGRFLRVRSKNGAEGYVPKQYITAETPKPILIERLEQERIRLSEKLVLEQRKRAEAVAELDSLRSSQTQKRQTLKGGDEECRQALAQAEKDLEASKSQFQALLAKSGKVVQISQESERLQQENARLLAELESAREDSSQLLVTGMIPWFLAGAGVFFFGWLIGKISRSKRRF